MEQDYGFAVRYVAGKGKGIIAQRPFQQGDVIFAERPIFTLQQEALVPEDASAILLALTRCTPEQREGFYQLHNCHADASAIPCERGIYDTNALSCEASGNITNSAAGVSARCGIFLLASRINSSCVPNVNHDWDEETGQLVLRAVKEVLPGDELCIAYGNILAGREERRAELMARFGFECACEACALSGQALEESNFRRECLGGMYRDHVQGVSDEDPMEGLGEVMLALRYLREEGLVVYGSVFYRTGFTFCAAVSDFTNARAWARKAYQLWCMLFGERKAESWKLFVQNPNACEQASTCRRRTLAGPDALAWSYLGLS